MGKIHNGYRHDECSGGIEDAIKNDDSEDVADGVDSRAFLFFVWNNIMGRHPPAYDSMPGLPYES